MLNRSAVSIDRLTEWGRVYEKEGQINDAIDFYAKASATDALEKLLPLVREDGDVFAYGRIVKAIGRAVSAEEWVSLGRRAAELGKDAFAREAFKRGGMETAQEVESQGSAAH
jgi:hypothetical protein